MPMSNQIHSAGPDVADNEEEEQSLDHADIKSGTFEIPQKDDPPPTEEPKLAKPPSHRSERSNTGKKKSLRKISRHHASITAPSRFWTKLRIFSGVIFFIGLAVVVATSISIMRPVHESIFESNFPTHAPSGAPTIIEIMGVSNTGDENSGSITEDPTELLEETRWVSPELQVPIDEMPIDDGIVPNIIEIAMLGFGGLLMLPLLLAVAAWVGKMQRRHGGAGYDDDSFDLGSSDDNDSIGGGGGPTGQYGYDYYGEADQPSPQEYGFGSSGMDVGTCNGRSWKEWRIDRIGGTGSPMSDGSGIGSPASVIAFGGILGGESFGGSLGSRGRRKK